jgi:hypothetical protein
MASHFLQIQLLTDANTQMWLIIGLQAWLYGDKSGLVIMVIYLWPCAGVLPMSLHMPASSSP